MSAEHHKLVGLLCTLFANMCVNISVTISALIAGISRHQAQDRRYTISLVRSGLIGFGLPVAFTVM
jgi:predicted benzoate:H+ symporter BenE